MRLLFDHRHQRDLSNEEEKREAQRRVEEAEDRANRHLRFLEAVRDVHEHRPLRER